MQKGVIKFDEAKILDPGESVVEMSGGNQNLLVLTDRNRVFCLGWPCDKDNGKTPRQIQVGGAVLSMAAGDHQNAVLFQGEGDAGLTIKCWNHHENKRCGDLNTDDVVQLLAGQTDLLALTKQGSIRCSREPTNRSNTMCHALASAEKHLKSGEYVVQMATSWNHGVALTNLGNIMCWGYDDNGKSPCSSMQGLTCETLSGGNQQSGCYGRATAGDVVQVAAAKSSTCLLLSSGRIVCNGWDSRGQVTQAPTVAPGEVVKMVGGGAHYALHMKDGTVRVWGVVNSLNKHFVHTKFGLMASGWDLVAAVVDVKRFGCS